MKIIHLCCEKCGSEYMHRTGRPTRVKDNEDDYNVLVITLVCGECDAKATVRFAACKGRDFTDLEFDGIIDPYIEKAPADGEGAGAS
jgi:hypothetical protein